MENGLSCFHEFVHSRPGQLIVQPRMGFSQFDRMREGLACVKNINAHTVGTITLDSFTRTGDFRSAKEAIENHRPLNGYPIVSYGARVNRQLIDGLAGPDFPVQVRHGCSRPESIFKAIIDAGIDATEGGPVSYCLPYGRVPLTASAASWRACCEMFAEGDHTKRHIESFGGCIMGQLCPPAMLIAVTVVEALFFRQYGVRSFSVSLSQGSNFQQDAAALSALRIVSRKYLGDQDQWHIVYYTFMGKFPVTVHGAKAIMKDSVRIAKSGKADRIIVKTIKEAHQIPSIEDNRDALIQADRDFRAPLDPLEEQIDPGEVERITEEADFLIEVLLNADNNLENAIAAVFSKGYWDIPFCLHPDNRNAAFARLDDEGRVEWADTGNIPFPARILKNHRRKNKKLSSKELLLMVSYNQIKYDFPGWKADRENGPAGEGILEKPLIQI
ncbi:MAG: methylaspartate mutase [Lewinellaceae bacterium]|nr:hypothetical protein [Lewinella sp.]MCB9278621.1 methylaspartate mutase [Lewinellaceae bacterium]